MMWCHLQVWYVWFQGLPGPVGETGEPGVRVSDMLFNNNDNMSPWERNANSPMYGPTENVAAPDLPEHFSLAHMVNLAPFVSETSPKANDSELSDKTGS